MSQGVVSLDLGRWRPLSELRHEWRWKVVELLAVLCFEVIVLYLVIQFFATRFK